MSQSGVVQMPMVVARFLIFNNLEVKINKKLQKSFSFTVGDRTWSLSPKNSPKTNNILMSNFIHTGVWIICPYGKSKKFHLRVVNGA